MGSAVVFVYFLMCLLIYSDTTDDILAKYRKPAVVAKPAADGLTTAAENSSRDKDRIAEDGENIPVYDSNNLENCKAFLDAKKKLRLILSHVDLQACLLHLSSLVRYFIVVACLGLVCC